MSQITKDTPVWHKQSSPFLKLSPLVFVGLGNIPVMHISLRPHTTTVKCFINSGLSVYLSYGQTEQQTDRLCLQGV